MTLISHLGPRLAPGSVVVEPEPPAAEPLRLTRGLMARDRSRMVTGDGTTPNALGQLVVAGVGGSCVVEVTVSSLYRDVAGVQSINPVGLAALLDDLDWAHSLGLRVLVRIMYGYYAPAFVKEAAGGAMVWYTNDGSTGTGPSAPSDPAWRQMPNGMLRWWTTAAADHYENFLTLLFAEADFAEHPALAGITYAATMTQYAEPDIKQFAVLENRQTALAALPGATTAEKCANYQAMDGANVKAGILAHRATSSVARCAMYFSYNNYQFLTATPAGWDQSWQTTIAQMEYQVATLGRLTVLENNSFRNPLFFQAQMYAHQLAQRDRTEPFPVPLHYQTQTNVKLEAAWDSQPVGEKVTTPRSTIELALARRANSVELANGSEKASVTKGTPPVQRWSAMTTSEAAAYNAAFRTVGLYAA